MKSAGLVLIHSVLLAVPYPALAQQMHSGVDRLYVLECGHGIAPDQGWFSPGYNDGKPLDFADNCYLIHHTQGYLLWGSGVADKFFETAGGLPSLNGAPNWVRSNTLARQLEQLRVKPSDILYIGLTNSHIDHIGNLELFPKATILIQKSEWDFAQGHRYAATPDEARFKADHPVTKIEGDYDVFGDESVQLIATPSVSPGNQSLLVKLPKTGTILLSGDVIHFQYGWDNRIVPGNVWNKEQTVASFKRLTEVMAKNNAQLWIEHDKAQSDTRRFSPDYYE
jgi:N-acyl homoserine lactone hydrolase